MRVQVPNMSMKGSKLFIRGVAPSAEVKNRIWDQIKLIDPTFSDLVCGISVSQQQRQPVAEQAPAAMTAGAVVSGGQDQQRYTVKLGDTLYRISSQFYGDSNQYTKIFNANRNILWEHQKPNGATHANMGPRKPPPPSPRRSSISRLTPPEVHRICFLFPLRERFAHTHLSV